MVRTPPSPGRFIAAVVFLASVSICHSLVVAAGPASAGPDTAVVSPAPSIATPGESPAWLRHLDAYRASGGLPGVVFDARWNLDAISHARYTVHEDVLGHAERTSSPWYTAGGDEAARNGNVMASGSETAGEEYIIDLWMKGPFHALGILDPRLERTGFGLFRDDSGRYRSAATLDVIRGRTRATTDVTWPVLWPGPGGRVPIGSYDTTEYPDPLSGCPGYRAPSGLPIIAQFGTGRANPIVAASAFLRDGQPAEHCVYTEHTYANSHETEQAFGRAVLAGRDAVVLVPKAPLVQGSIYSASLTVNGVEHVWAFTIGPFAASRKP
jgi:uncharacterized protein YkwD